MKDLLTFLVSNITGSNDITITENDEDGRISLIIEAPKETIGLIIGKEGKTIKNIRRIMGIKGALEKKSVSVSIQE